MVKTCGVKFFILLKMCKYKSCSSESIQNSVGYQILFYAVWICKWVVYPLSFHIYCFVHVNWLNLNESVLKEWNIM